MCRDGRWTWQLVVSYAGRGDKHSRGAYLQRGFGGVQRGTIKIVLCSIFYQHQNLNSAATLKTCPNPQLLRSRFSTLEAQTQEQVGY